MRLRWMVVLAGVVLIGLMGCGQKKEGTDATDVPAEMKEGSKAPVKSLTVAVIPKCTGGEFWETVEVGARQAAEALGVELKWDGTQDETMTVEQSKIIENMVNLGVDGMALAPLNEKAQKKPVENTVAAGIPVVIFDSNVEGDKHLSFVATDNEKGGQVGAEHMIELLGGKKGKVMVLRFLQGTGSTERRAKGFMETMKAAGIEVVADPYPEDGSVAGSKKTATNTLEGFVKNNKLELDGLFACNLYSAVGMLEALEDLRKSGIKVETPFIGFDTDARLLKALQDGTIAALVSQNPKRMGYLAVETLVKHLRGETIEERVDTGVELVTVDRLAKEPEIRELVGLDKT